jgi:hypothetical protein
MRRKVIQDFANVCCQMFLTSLSNYDQINLALFGSGLIHIDFLTMRCEHNKHSISPLFYCMHFRSWLEGQCQKHDIDYGKITKAELFVQVNLSLSYGKGELGWLTSKMDLFCKSCIATAEKEYTSEMSDNLDRGFGQILIDHQY